MLMGATNLVESLDPALVREGRIDIHIRVDMPNESSCIANFRSSAITKALEALRSGRVRAALSWSERCKDRVYCRSAGHTGGRHNRQIEESDLRHALDETGGWTGRWFNPLTGKT